MTDQTNQKKPRPQIGSSKNRCRSCGHTWFPGDMSRAIECPRCESPNIAYGWVDQIPAILLTFVMLGFVGTIVWTLLRIVLSYLR